MKKIVQITTILLCFMQFSFAQENTIKGVVSDGYESLPGVAVLIKGANNGVETDFDGKYTIKAKKGDVLVFRYIGMITKEVIVKNATTINVVLKEDSAVLDEIVIVAYGTSSKEAITGSVSKIKTEDIQKRTISNISSVIEGSTTGVIVTAASGQPGSGQNVRIRGFGSFGSSNSPLYVVDGIPINGSINGINPSDIESISILKDAGATALYGNKASNGVILVTTKKGKRGKGEFKVNYSTSVVTRGTDEYDRLAPGDLYEAYWESYRNGIARPGVNTDAEITAAGITASAQIFNELKINPYNVPNNQIVGTNGKINPSAQLLYPEDLDWESALDRVGIRRNVDVSFNTRSDKGGYYASLGYLEEEGYVVNTNFNRLTARLNSDLKATNWLKVGLNLAGTITDGNQANTGSSSSTTNPFRFTRAIGSIYPVNAHNPITGAYLLDAAGKRTPSLNRGVGASNQRHAIYELENDIDIDERNRLDAKTYFELTIAEGLKFRTNLSYEIQNYYNIRYRNPYIGDGAPNADGSRRSTKTTTKAYNQILSYDKSFNSVHNLDIILGHESQDYSRTTFFGSAENEIFEGNIELVNFATPGVPESYIDKVKEESYFGRLNYNFDTKYFLSASIRTDGNSRFHPDNRWGTFWSLGSSWSMHKEKFIKDITWIDNLKLRASYGQLGNANLGSNNRYVHLDLLRLGENNQLEPGVVRSSLGNPNLVWEKSIHTDFAIEFSLFNRLRGSVEYFNKVSKDLIFEVPLPLSAGGLNFDNQNAKLENIGELFNRGFETSLSYDIIKKEDLIWTMTVNASTIQNEFTKLPDGQENILTGTKQIQVGRGLFDYYIRDWYGVDPSDGSGLFVAEDPTTADVRTIDGVAVTPDDANAKQDYLGSVLPDVYGSIDTSVKYKNFSLGFLFTYQIGGDNLDNGYRSLFDGGSYGGALHTDLLNRWRKPGDITDIPRLDPVKNSDWDGVSDRFLVDASYLSLRQINASFNFPKQIIEKAGISTASLNINAENVFNINARKGFNQQQSFSGNTSNVYIPSRTITIGLNVTF